jgi:hypothetical protein
MEFPDEANVAKSVASAVRLTALLSILFAVMLFSLQESKE